MAVSETLLRSMVHDPAGDNQYLTTDQYTAIMALEATEYRAAALAARMIASQFVQKVNLEVDQSRLLFAEVPKLYEFSCFFMIGEQLQVVWFLLLL
jgi:hypothetical protein